VGKIIFFGSFHNAFLEDTRKQHGRREKIMLEFFDGMNRWERTAELIQIIIWLPANG
jgi:hypothetical protein